jgi:hypothetical protein
MVRMRSSSGMNDESALRTVVLPVPVPPETTMLRRAPTQALRNSAMPGVIAPFLINSSGESACLGNLRMLIDGPSSASGGMMTLTREPSGRRASTIGLLSSTRRPSGATMRSTTRMTSSLSRNLTSVSTNLPLRSAKTWCGPLTSTSVMASSRSSASSGPKPRMSASTRSKMSARSVRLSGSPRSATTSAKSFSMTRRTSMVSSRVADGLSSASSRCCTRSRTSA